MSATFSADCSTPGHRQWTLATSTMLSGKVHGEPGSRRRLQQRGSEVIPAFEDHAADAPASDAASDARANQLRRSISEVDARRNTGSCNYARDRQIQRSGSVGISICAFISAHWESRTRGDGELRITLEPQMGVEDFSVRGAAEMRVEFPQRWGHAWSACQHAP